MPERLHVATRADKLAQIERLEDQLAERQKKHSDIQKRFERLWQERDQASQAVEYTQRQLDDARKSLATMIGFVKEESS